MDDIIAHLKLFLICRAPSGFVRPHFGSHWVRKCSRTFLYSCTLHQSSSSPALVHCGGLDCGQPLATPPRHPSRLVGGLDGTGDILGCIHVCTEKEVGLKKKRGGGFVIVTGQIPGGKFLACLCGRISNQRPADPPFPPGPGNPINCVRQRELVSIDPHSAGPLTGRQRTQPRGD